VTEIETYSAKRSGQKAGTANVLIVDGDSGSVRLILEILARKGICANLTNDKKTAIEFLDKNDCDLVFTSADINRPDDGFELLRAIKRNSPELPVIMLWSPATEWKQPRSTQGSPRKNISSELSVPALSPSAALRVNSVEGVSVAKLVETVVRAMSAGCSEFLIKPASREQIQMLLDTFVPSHSVWTAASAQQASHCLYQIVGRSPKLVQTIALAERIAPTSAPVLISGESGTGKELISLLIHQKSKRALGPYIKVNCAALSDSLLESELFGHEKGAFTGAYAQRKGRFEMANGGTILLDEITETPLRFQAKLLRVLEEQEFERVGGNENVRVNVRVISTTNKDLPEEVRHDRLRRDLYYRLSGVRLEISPLRERPEDLPELVWHFVNLYASQANRRITSLDPVMIDIFTKYDWPGNVRQLRNVVLTSLILGIGPVLSLADVSWLFDELQPLPLAGLTPFRSGKAGPAGPDGMDEGRLTMDADHLSCLVPLLPQGQACPRKSGDPSYRGLGGIPLEQVERRAILDTLRQTAGNQARAAKVLGISDRTLRDKIRRYRQSAPGLTAEHAENAERKTPSQTTDFTDSTDLLFSSVNPCKSVSKKNSAISAVSAAK
jgi:DNA-binding NtrC family response regulator